jgi:hypothetical protein
MAGRGGIVPQISGEVCRLPDGTLVCQFPSTVPELFAPLKLAVVRDKWDLTMEPPADGRIVFRKSASGGMWSALSGRKGGLEVVVELARGGKAVGEVMVNGKLVGAPDRRFVDAAQTAIPRVLEEIMSELGNMADRRKSPRIVTDLPLKIHPLHSDGTLEPPVSGQCKDVSAGGVCFTTADSIRTRYAYLEFASVTATSGLAVLVKLIRSQPQSPAGGHVYAGPYRVDL